MSDARLRGLERRLQEEGTEAAQLELLRARVQLGDLRPLWLRVAAFLGHRPARKLLTAVVPVVPIEVLDEAFDELPEPARLAAGLALQPAPGPSDPGARGALLRARGLLEARLAGASLQQAGAGLQQVGAGLQQAGSGDPEQAAALADELERRWPYGSRGAGAEDANAARRLLGLLSGEPGALGGLVRAAIGFSGLNLARAKAEERRRVAKTLRAALVPWALAGRGEPPAQLIPPEARAEEPEEPAPAPGPLAAFRARLAAPEVEREASALRRRRHERALSADRLRLAARCGDPAAWLAAAAEGEPELLARPPGTSASLAAQLASLSQPFARRPWARSLLAHQALALGDALVERFEALEPSDARPRAAVAAARAFARAPQGAPSQLRAAARAASHAARRRGPGPAGRAAAQGASWAAQLVARALTRARLPGFGSARQDPLARALAAGFTAQELWDLLRGSAIAWALAEGEAPAQPPRAYRASDSFAEGEAIAHPAFGLGRVRAARGPRIEVEFADGSRTLVQGLGGLGS